MASLIRVGEARRDVAPKNGRAFELAELQELVGGAVEPLPLRRGLLMLMDEDGRAKRLAANEEATRMVLLARPEFTKTVVGLVGRPFVVVGTVVVVNRREMGA